MSRMSWFHRQRARSQPTQPTKQQVVVAPQCSFCANRSVTRCEYPECDVPLCHRCRIRKGGGNLCRRHKDARLVQVVGRPSEGAVPMRGFQLERFKAKGPAVPHF